MKMRKIISFVLTLSLVLGSFSMAFAATPKDVVGTPNEEAVQVLMGLGVVNGYPDGTYKPENIVTRAEMAKLVVVALGLEDYAKQGTSSYPDMVGAGWAQGYVGYATSLGIVKGYPDGTFKPSATVSYPEVATMIVRALGYTDASLLPATWPANFVVKAKALGIFDDVTTSSAGANRGDVAQMLYNALSVSMGTVDVDNKYTLTIPTDNMLLRLQAKVTTGVVIYGNEDTVINLVPYTGTYGDVYKNKDGDIVAVVVASDSITGKYNADFGTLGAGVFEGSDDVDYNVSAAVAGKSLIAYFWNGVQEPTSTNHPKYSIDTISTATNDVTVAVELSGKRVTDAYAASYWKVSKHDLFDATAEKNIKNDKKLLGVKFILDDNDNIDSTQFVLEGVKSLADIKVDNVVYVYDGWGGAGIKKIAVGTEIVTGEVTEVDGSKYFVGGKSYEFANNAVGDKPAVGDNVKLSLDAYGDIYDVELISSTASMFGVATLWATDTYGDKVTKIYTADDATKRFTVNDDAKYTTASATIFPTGGTLTATAGAPLLIGYGVDADGNIDAINQSAVATITPGGVAKVKTTKVFTTQTGSDVSIASDVVVFTTSGTSLDVTTITNVQNTSVLAAGGQYILNSDKDTLVALMVKASDADKTDDSVYGVINNVSKVKDGDNIVSKVVALVDGATVTKLTTFTSNITGTESVGLYKMTPNTDGKLKDVTAESTVKIKVGSVNNDGTVITATPGSVKYTVATDAVVYQAVMKANNYALDSYAVSGLTSIDAGYTVWMYDLDASVDTGYGIYDIVIYADASYIDLASVNAVNASAALITNSAIVNTGLASTTAAVVNAFAKAEAINLAANPLVTVTLVSATYVDASVIGTIDANDTVTYTVILSKDGYDVTKTAKITLT